MIADRVLGSAADDAEVDWVEIDWPQTVRRALRLTSRAGRAVDVLLPPNATLRQGDVLSRSPLVAVWVRPCELIVLSPTSPRQYAEAATHLGNLHIAVELFDDKLLTPDDGPAVEVADALGVPYWRVVGRFHPLKISVQSPLVQAST
jgi:urease accessory protein